RCSPSNRRYRTSSHHLHGFDPQLLPGEHSHIGASAGTQDDEVVDLEFRGAAAAAPSPARFRDLQVGSLPPGVCGDDFEAEPHGIRHHSGELSDFQVDSLDLAVGHRVQHRVHNALGNAQLVHQQIRGNGSPTRTSTMRVPPKAVCARTIPGGSVVIRPMIAACSPSGWERSAASAASACAPSTTATARPSQATYSGSMPSSSAAPRTSVRTGTACSSSSTETPAARASSLSTVATPPRVGS